MKKKNLEKAVLLTVMLMSLNGAVGAAEPDSEEFLQPLNPVNLKDEESVIMANHPLETVVIIAPQKIPGYNPEDGAFKAYNSTVNVVGQGKFRAEFHSEDAGLSANGIQILNNSTLNFGVSDATVLVTGTSNEATGLFAKDNSHLTANNLFINVDGGTTNNYGLVMMYGSDADVANAVVNVNGGAGQNTGIGVYGSAFNADNVNITVSGGTGINTGLDLTPGTTTEQKGSATIGGGNITADGGYMASGIYSTLTDATVNGDLTVTAQNATAANYAVTSMGGNLTFNGTANLNASGAASAAVAAQSHTDMQTNQKTAANVTFAGDVNINASSDSTAYAAFADGEGTAIDFQKSLTAAGDNNVISASGGAAVKVNSSGTGTVKYNGSTLQDDGSTIEMSLNNAESVWNLTDTSSLTSLTHANNALLDMTADGAAYSNLTVDKLSGNGGIIKMDIDETKNADNSDRLYVGTHSGLHYIDVNPKGQVIDPQAALGTVLVSVKDEQGEFKAHDAEGKLFWESYALTSEEVTGGEYTTNWVLSDVKLDADKTTTTVGAILGGNALNFHAWRGENGQLMRRMGELRNNGSDNEGAWFRVHGSEMSRSDSAAFENKYTSYELGYDQVTKHTEDMTRYTGAALSYTDGSSTYNSGSGDNDSKAISFYNTDIYSSGHYLDLVFKYAQFNNDFDVFDTYGSNITGEMKNTGISVSAEYGRKNDLNGGWYIEPQAQLTLGYFTGDDYETSNGIGVDQSGIASVLGRVGFNIGKELGDSGVVYARASLLHEFAGDYDITMTDTASGMSRKEDGSFGDTWVEYGIGAALKTGKNNHLYFDLAKAEGSDFDRDWMWNAGMRWTF